MSLQCLIVDEMHPSLQEQLADVGVEAAYCPHFDREQIKKHIGDYHGLIIRSKTKVDRDLLQEARNLRFVARAGAGVDNIEVGQLEELGIKIINAPEGNRDAVAEHTMGLILNLLNNITLADREVREEVWQREVNRGEELQTKAVGIIGYGNMGAAVADRLRSFGCPILAYDKYKKGFGNDIVQEVSMDDIYKQADIVSIHLPLTSETNRMFDQDLFSRFRKPIYLINTARGEILSLKALEYCLQKNIIRGAALDVLEKENLSEMTKAERETFEYLAQSTKILFTPHIAGWSTESYARINQVLVEKIRLELS